MSFDAPEPTPVKKTAFTKRSLVSWRVSWVTEVKADAPEKNAKNKITFPREVVSYRAQNTKKGKNPPSEFSVLLKYRKMDLVCKCLYSISESIVYFGETHKVRLLDNIFLTGPPWSVASKTLFQSIYQPFWRSLVKVCMQRSLL